MSTDQTPPASEQRHTTGTPRTDAFEFTALEWCDEVPGVNKQFGNAKVVRSEVSRRLESALAEAAAVHAKEIKDLHKAYGCELRDPNGNIWEHAASLEKQLAGYHHKALDTTLSLGAQLAAALKERDEANADFQTACKNIATIESRADQLRIDNESLRAAHAATDALLESVEPVMVEMLGYLDRMGQEGVRERARATLAKLKQHRSATKGE